MNNNLFVQIDQYIEQLFRCTDASLAAAQRRAKEADLPEIAVAPVQGKLLSLLAKMIGAERILEIGALGGYSTIWLARGMAEEGQLVTLEADPRHAKVARENVEEAGVGDRVEVIVGPAIESLPRLEAESRGPFDMVFIDADKESYPAYLEWCVKLARPGALILADNVIRKGAVMNPNPEDTAAVGADAFNRAIANHPGLDAIVIQQVGAKGHDGLAIAIVK